MDIKKEIGLLKKQINNIYKEYNLSSLKEKEELSIKLENLNKRLKILNMLLKDLALTKIINDDEIIERIYDAYLEKKKEKLAMLVKEQEELKSLIEFDDELAEQIVLYPIDIRPVSYRNLNIEKTRSMLQQFRGSNLNLIKEKIELFGISPIKEAAIRLLNRVNEISALNVALQNNEETKYAIHLISMCAYSLNLESEEFMEFINQEQIKFQDNITKENKTYIELNDQYEVMYVDNDRLVEFVDVILSNKNKFIEFVTTNNITKEVFKNSEIVSDFFKKISNLKNMENYSDLVVLLRYCYVFDLYKEIIENMTNTKSVIDIKEYAKIDNNFNNSNANERTNLYNNNNRRIKELSRMLEEKKLLSIELKREEIINILDGTILKSIKPVDSHKVHTLRAELVNLQIELEEFNKLKDEYNEIIRVLDSLRLHPDTKRMRELLVEKEKLNSELEAITTRLRECRGKLEKAKENALVDGKTVDVDYTRTAIEKKEQEITNLKEDIELIKKEIKKYQEEKEKVKSQNIYVDSNGNEKKSVLSKFIFKRSKTFKDNEMDKENALDQIDKTIEELTKELIKRENDLLVKEEELKKLYSSLNDDVISFDVEKKETKKIFDEYNEKSTLLKQCLDSIEEERKNVKAMRLEKLESRLMELTLEYPTKYKMIRSLLDSLDKEQLEILEPDLYASLLLSIECYEEAMIDDSVLEELGDIEITMFGIDTKYKGESDIYDGLISGKINNSQLSLEESEKIIMEDENLDRKL